MEGRFRPLDRETLWLMPPSIQDWLPQDHLARFISDVASRLDLSSIRRRYAGRGSAAYQPEMMVGLLFYGYATGIFSSRKLERATYDSVAFRYLTADQHPEHDTISDFRKRFLPELSSFFEQILLIAQESGLLKIGRVSIDGTKIKANASKHHALSYGHTREIEKRIKEEVAELLRLAEEADATAIPDGMDLPDEMKRREDRLRAIEEAQARIRSREQERIAAERAEYEAKLAARQDQERKNGKKPRGRPPQPPNENIDLKAQINLTDEESRIMPVSGGGFEQAYNAQIAVDCDSRLIVMSEISQKPTDRPLLSGMLQTLAALPVSLGKVDELLADAGYFSKENVEECIRLEMTPYISDAREVHFPNLRRFEEPAPLSANATNVEKARRRLRTRKGREVYAKRKSTVEPVFGIVKEAMGFRRFLLRTLEKVRREWKLVCLAYNLKRLFRLSQGRVPVTVPAT